MSPKIKQYRPILIFIGMYFLFKCSYLFVPYFWEELGFYSRAALYMHDHTLSLLPGALPPELSRGHPSLCTLIFAIGYSLLGPFAWVGHLIALLLSCTLLIVVYRFAEDFFGQRVAFFSTVLLALQPVFFVQSTLVLPEIILALFCTLAIYAYAKENYMQVAIFSTLAIFVKETAIVLPFCFILCECIRGRRYGIGRKIILNILCVLSPIVAWGVFLWIQKFQNGWYFYPQYTEYISFSFSSLNERLGYFLSFLFKGQGRYLWSILVGMSSIVFVWQNRKYLVTPVKFFKTKAQKREWQISAILITYIVFALLVSVLKSHHARYMLLVLPVICILIAMLSIYFVQQCKHPLWGLMLLLLLAVPFEYYSGDGVFSIDIDMSYLDVVRAHQQMVSFVDENIDSGKIIVCGFPVYSSLVEKRAGYTDIDYMNVYTCTKEMVAKADYLIFSSIGTIPSCKADEEKYKVVKTIKSAYSEFSLYKREKK